MLYGKTIEEIRNLIRQASGREKASFAIRNARIFHMTDGTIEEGDILICGKRIAGIGKCCREIPSEEEFDAKGMMGKGIFHSCDIWLFSEAIVRNAKERVLNRKKQ